MGASTVHIGNWDELENPVYHALYQQFKNNQANADQWAKQYLDAVKEYEQKRQEQIKKQLKNEKKWRKTQLAIATAQKLAAAYFADKQDEAAKAAQKHQIEVWQKEKEWAQRYQDLWFNKYRPIEEKMLSEKANQKPYEAQYEVAEARAVTDVRREFALAREQMRRCIDPRCTGFLCHQAKTLAIAEARAAVGAINKGYRAEEARKDIKDAQREESVFALLQLGRGLQSQSLNALNSARAAAQVAATYQPNAGYQAAIGDTLGYFHGYAADRAGMARQRASILGRQGANYLMGQGYTGNAATTSAQSFSYNATHVTGVAGGNLH